MDIKFYIWVSLPLGIALFVICSNHGKEPLRARRVGKSNAAQSGSEMKIVIRWGDGDPGWQVTLLMEAQRGRRGVT